MSNIENSICEAVELIVDKSISEAGYDRTIQATVKSCVDASIGKYVVKYQDSSFYAFATSADVTYTNGSTVYVLIPGNDMSNDKTILGTVSKLGINYVTQAEGDEAYDYVGTNCVSSEEISLSSYRNHNTSTSYVETIYDVNETDYDANETEEKVLKLNTTSLNTYIKGSSSLICGAWFKTSLNAEQQYQGNYGIIFELEFNDNATGAAVTRQYIVDVDNMTGDPYRLTLGKRQYEIFTIDGANFNRVTKISLFTKDFPYHKDDSEIEEQKLFDITVSNIEIYGAIRMSDNELNGCGISLLTPNGSFFSDGDLPSSTLNITAQVKIKGKLVDATAQKIPFYWFKEDLSILPASLKYNKHGGRGWRCLNQYNIITEDPSQVEWIPAKDTYTVSINEATARENKYKCVIVYDNAIYTKEITIKNLQNQIFDISIVSDGGTTFYYDIGRPNLTCIVKDANGEIINDVSKYKKKEDIPQDRRFIYVWAKEDPYGNLTNLPEDVLANKEWVEDYSKKIKTLNDLESSIMAGIKFPNAESENLQKAWRDVKFYDNIQMVSIKEEPSVDFNNVLYHVAIGEITNFNKYKCSVYREESGDYLGTATIVLKNTLNSEDMYTLVINNGTQVYKYNEYGVSPASKSLDAPIQIPALSFSIYDNLGNQIDEEILKRCIVKWKVPIKNTLLQDISIEDSGNIGATDAERKYQYYSGMELGYKINNKYYYDKTNNNIELTVDYKGMSLTAHTNFTFVKEGEPGTNGTEYTAKIVPNTDQTDVPLYPVLTIQKNAGIETALLNFKGKASNELVCLAGGDVAKTAPFKVVLYKAGEVIFSGTQSGVSSEVNTDPSDEEKKDPSEEASSKSKNIPVTVLWEILSNNYKKGESDASDLTIDKDYGIMSYTGDGGEAPANIIKCTVYYGDDTDDKQNGRYMVTATLPIIKSIVNDGKYYISLKENTGFLYAQYTSDGSMPKFDSANPFEIEVFEEIDNIYEKVSGIGGKHAINLFKWGKTGRVYNFASEEGGFIPSNDLIYLGEGRYKPASQYDGLCVTNAVTCTCIGCYKPIAEEEIPTDGEEITTTGEETTTDEGEIITTVGTIHIPIHFFLNKYGLSQLNGWDGNSVQIDDEGGFILSPQMGAGKKEEDNSFTGVLMGEVQEPNRTTSDTGIIGYNKGVRSFLLDAESGGALFGSGAGKIGIDPAQNKALLYSGNYWKNYKENGFPSDYNSTNGKGMLIDLTTPQIHFGSGNFSVNANGHLVAKGGGSIAGWNITDYQLSSNTGYTGINSVSSTDDNGAKKQKVSIPSSTSAGEVESVNKALAFWAGGGSSSAPKFYVSHDGYLRAATATIGSGSNKIYIGNSVTVKGNSAIFSGEKNAYNASASGFYIGTDGISLGKYGIIDEEKQTGASNFQVDSKGNMIAKTGYIGNGNKGWTIKSNCLVNGDKTSYSDTKTGVYIGTSGIGLGEGAFYVNSGGFLHAESGTIGCWSLSNSSIYAKDNNKELDNDFDGKKGMYFGASGLRIKDTFSVNNSGKLISTSGSIGGWDITGTTITKNNIVLDSNGSISSGKNWSIKSDGTATFNNINVRGGAVSLGGTTLSSGGGGSGGGGGFTTIPTSTLIGADSAGNNGTKLNTYIQNLVVKKLEVLDSFTYGKYHVVWQDINSIKSIAIGARLALSKITYMTDSISSTDATIVSGWGSPALELSFSYDKKHALCADNGSSTGIATATST